MIGTFLSFAASAFRDHLPKVIAAVLATVILGSIGLWIAKEEREVVRHENSLVEKGEQRVRVEQQQEVLNDVGTYRNAIEHPTDADLGRVRAQADRCTRNPASCE